MAQKIDLSRFSWKIDKDEKNTGESAGWSTTVSPTAKDTVIPSMIQHTFPWYFGTAFYWCSFPAETEDDDADSAGSQAGTRNAHQLLRFFGVNYKSTVWLNGVKLGVHEGSESVFEYDVTEILQKENLLTVKVIVPGAEDIEGLNLTNIPNRNTALGRNAGSNINDGGIWYGAEIVTVPKYYIADYFLKANAENGELTADITLAGLDDIPWEDIIADLSLSVYDREIKPECICSTGKLFGCSNFADEHTLTLTVPDLHLWDIDDPHLYRAEIRLESGFGVHTVIQDFGFKDFRLKDGYFYLNGRRIFLKSSHSGNVYPGGQMIPTDRSLFRRDMVLMKAAGFNTLRCISGLFREEQLKVCDEIGLLVIDECMASWQVGVGPYPVGDTEAMLKRYDSETSAMVLRDRNHTCIAAWELLNETLESDVSRRAMAFLPKMKALDDTRLILLSSGRWDADYTVGSASNPGSRGWENVWGLDGTGHYTWNAATQWGTFFNGGDFHFYPVTPMNAEDKRRLRRLGEGVRPVFLSETGIGSLFHVIDEWKEFQAHPELSYTGEGEYKEEAGWMKYQAEALEKDWKRFGLESIYPFPEMMLKESQRLNAGVRTELFHLIRSNPQLCGFSVTGLLDHGMCGEGLWSYFRKVKPAMFDALADGWARLRFCLFVPGHVYRGQSFEIEAVLANEGVLAPGKYTADFAITGAGNASAGNVLERLSVDFTVDEKLACPVMKKTVTVNAPTGYYRLTASLRSGGAPSGTELEFFVTDPAEIKHCDTEVRTVGLKEQTMKFLAAHGVTVRPFEQTGNTEPKQMTAAEKRADAAAEPAVILAGGNLDTETIRQLAAQAQKGARVLFLDPSPFMEKPNTDVCGTPIRERVDALQIPTLELVDYRDWLYHKECILTNHPVFDGMQKGLADFGRFDQVFPHPAFTCGQVPDEVIAPAFLTGYYAVEGSYASMHSACGFTTGEGNIFLNCFDIENNLGQNPYADRLLMNYVTYLKEQN